MLRKCSQIYIQNVFKSISSQTSLIFKAVSQTSTSQPEKQSNKTINEISSLHIIKPSPIKIMNVQNSFMEQSESQTRDYPFEQKMWIIKIACLLFMLNIITRLSLPPRSQNTYYRGAQL